MGERTKEVKQGPGVFVFVICVMSVYFRLKELRLRLKDDEVVGE
jgi:hypothetical protein